MIKPIPLPRVPHWLQAGAGVALAALAAALIACNESPTAPGISGSGALSVVIKTTGGDSDEDGYILVYSGQRRPAATNGTVLISAIPADIYTVELEDVADNCTVRDGSLRTVAVPRGGTREVAFHVVCDPTGVRIVTVTSGPELPPSYRVQVGDGSTRVVAPNDFLDVTRLTAGDYAVTIHDIVDGCELEGDAERRVSVEFRTLTTVSFAVTCGAFTGAVRVAVATGGVDLDPSGYTVATGNRSVSASVNGVVVLDLLPAGTHEIRLEGIASNCEPSGGDRVTVALTVGGPVRDTAHARFDLSCVRTDKIVYTSFQPGVGSTIVIAYADGSEAVTVARGHGPAWFPDGRRLVFSDVECSYYYGYGCSGGLKVFDTESGTVTPVPSTGAGGAPAVSPGGDRLAFVDDGWNDDLMVVRLDGSAPVRVRQGPASDPAWSPDGTRIIYGCRGSSGSSDLCAVNPDGSGFVQLTALAGFSSHPRWSPDGSRIVFASTAFNASGEIVTMAPDGSGFQRLTPGWSPSWTPDGSRILFVRNDGIHAINSDGTGLTRIRTGWYGSPVWRP